MDELTKYAFKVVPRPSSPIPCSSKCFTIVQGRVTKRVKLRKKVCLVKPLSIDRVPLSMKYKELIDLLEVSFQVFTPCMDNDIFEVRFERNLTKEELWEFKKSTMRESMILVNKFAQNVPGFFDHASEDQRRVVLTSTFPIICCVYAMTFDPATHFFKWALCSSDEIMKLVEQFDILKPVFSYFIAFAKQVKLFELNFVELACLCAIFLHNMSDNLSYKELILNTLEWYEKNTFPERRKRFCYVISFFRHMLEIHRIQTNTLYKFHVDPEYAIYPRFMIDDSDFDD